MTMRIKEFVTKRCFFTKKDGTRGMVPHKSVVLEDGTVVRWNRKSANWKIVGPERWDSAPATSLNTRAMVIAHEKGRMRSDVEEYGVFRHFQDAMKRLVDEETFLTIVVYLS